MYAQISPFSSTCCNRRAVTLSLPAAGLTFCTIYSAVKSTVHPTKPHENGDAILSDGCGRSSTPPKCSPPPPVTTVHAPAQGINTPPPARIKHSNASSPAKRPYKKKTSARPLDLHTVLWNPSEIHRAESIEIRRPAKSMASKGGHFNGQTLPLPTALAKMPMKKRKRFCEVAWSSSNPESDEDSVPTNSIQGKTCVAAMGGVESDTPRRRMERMTPARQAGFSYDWVNEFIVGEVVLAFFGGKNWTKGTVTARKDKNTADGTKLPVYNVSGDFGSRWLKSKHLMHGGLHIQIASRKYTRKSSYQPTVKFFPQSVLLNPRKDVAPLFAGKVKRGKEVSANVGYSLSQEKRYPLVYGPHCRADSQKRKGTALKRKLTKANRQLFSAHHQTVHEEVLEHGVSRVYGILVGSGAIGPDNAHVIKFICPLSRTRITLPVRGDRCSHPFECFDEKSYYLANGDKRVERIKENCRREHREAGRPTREDDYDEEEEEYDDYSDDSDAEFLATYKCPVCNHYISPENLVIDGFFWDLLTLGSEQVRVFAEGTEVVVQSISVVSKKTKWLDLDAEKGAESDGPHISISSRRV